MKLKEKYLLIFISLMTLALAKKFQAEKINSLDSEEQTFDYFNKMTTIDAQKKSILSSNEEEMVKIKIYREKIWDYLVKQRLGTEVSKNSEDSSINSCIGSKISSRKRDKDKFGGDSKLCKGNWQFLFDQDGRLFLENIKTKVVSWEATRYGVKHYGVSKVYDITEGKNLNFKI